MEWIELSRDNDGAGLGDPPRGQGIPAHSRGADMKLGMIQISETASLMTASSRARVGASE